MANFIKDRLCSWKKVFCKKAVGMILALWAVSGFFDLVRSEFVPEKYHLPAIVAMIPHLSWRTWVIVLLLIVIVVLMEGSYATSKGQEEASKIRKEEGKKRELELLNSLNLERSNNARIEAEKRDAESRELEEIESELATYNFRFRPLGAGNRDSRPPQPEDVQQRIAILEGKRTLLLKRMKGGIVQPDLE